MTDFERDEFAVVDCLRGIRHSTWHTWSRSKISTTYREMKIALHRFFPLALRVDSYHSVPFQFAQSTLVEARNPCQRRGYLEYSPWTAFKLTVLDPKGDI